MFDDRSFKKKKKKIQGPELTFMFRGREEKKYKDCQKEKIFNEVGISFKTSIHGVTNSWKSLFQFAKGIPNAPFSGLLAFS